MKEPRPIHQSPERKEPAKPKKVYTYEPREEDSGSKLYHYEDYEKLKQKAQKKMSSGPASNIGSE